MTLGVRSANCFLPKTKTVIEIFKTNVMSKEDAYLLVGQLNNQLGYKANFDLQDCDHILRVVNSAGEVEPQIVIRMLEKQGFCAEVLPDVVEHPVDRLK